jgi:hypothetical protein
VKKNYILLTLMFAFLMISCGDKKQESQTEVAASGDSSNVRISIDSYSPIFKQIMKSDAGMARGVNIGDKIETIQEVTPLTENQPENGKSYTVYFDGTDLNFADILYANDAENNIGAISIDVFIEKTTDVENLMKEFVDFFNKKYGTGKGISKMMTWRLPDGNILSVQDVSTAKDPGLKIVFAKNGDKLLMQ